MAFDGTPDRVPYYPAPSRPSADFGNTRIVLVLAAAIVITLIMMFSLGGDGRYRRHQHSQSSVQDAATAFAVDVTGRASSGAISKAVDRADTEAGSGANTGSDNRANSQPDNGAAAYAGADPVVVRRLGCDGIATQSNRKRLLVVVLTQIRSEAQHLVRAPGDAPTPKLCGARQSAGAQEVEHTLWGRPQYL